MTTRPAIGDLIEMPFMGNDVRIEVDNIPEDQPLFETDGLFIICDQYGEEHLTELDGETWVVANIDDLTAEQIATWVDRKPATPKM